MDTAELVKLARERVVAFDLGWLSWIAVTGNDRLRLLQNVLTNAVEGLSPGMGNHSLLLDDKGHIMGDLRVLVREDEVLIGVDPDARRAVRKALDHYVVTEDVVLVERDWLTLSFAGPEAVHVVEHLTGRAPPAGAFDHQTTPVVEKEAVVARLCWCEVPTVEVLVPAEHHHAVLAAAQDVGVPTGSEDVAETLRIEGGVPWWGRELGPEVLAVEAPLDDAIDEHKGCYVGQETVYRVRTRGRPNWLVRGLILEGGHVPDDGSEIFRDGSRVGLVTSATFSPTLGRPIALVRIRREVAGAGTPVRVKVHAAESPGEVVELPFVRH